MDLNINFNDVFVMIALLLILYIIGGILLGPLKGVFKLLVYSLIGCLVLLILNLFSNYTALKVPVNPISILTLGILGLPGLVLIVALNLLI